jgi:drug/metabolite transporter (DMT)-like permease
MAAEFSQWNDIFTNHLALAFMIDAFIVTILGSYYFAGRPIGQVKWYWFLLLSLIGGLGFSLPLYWCLNQKKP